MTDEQHPPTDVEMRHAATAYWSDDAIPPNHPARRDAEARWGRWIADHDEAVRVRAVRKEQRRGWRLLIVMWVVIVLNLVSVLLNGASVAVRIY